MPRNGQGTTDPMKKMPPIRRRRATLLFPSVFAKKNWQKKFGRAWSPMAVPMRVK